MARGIFEDKRAVLSGGTGVIGNAIAERIIEEGGHLVLVGRREEPLREAIARLGVRASYSLVDVDSDAAVEKFAAGLDHVDVLVCTAGWTVVGPVEQVPVDQALAMFSTRFFGQCRLIKSTLPKLRQGGIILMCSGVGNTAFYPYYAFGSAVAAAIEAYAHHLAAEVASRKIRVNVISPGWTTIEKPDPARAEGASRPYAGEAQLVQFFGALDCPMHEVVDPKEFADALVFVARAKHFTGQVIRIDGARSTTDNPLGGHVDPFSFAPQG